MFLMCLEATYVICREHIASRKIIKYVCECGKNPAVKTGWPHNGNPLLCCLNCVASGHAGCPPCCLLVRGSLCSLFSQVRFPLATVLLPDPSPPGGGGALQSLLGTTSDLKVNPHTQFSTLLSGEALKGKESPLLSSHSELPKILLFASKFFC